MYAVIKTGGKQYRVEEGDEIFVEKIDAESGAEVVFPVLALALSNDDGLHLGDALANAKVSGEVVKQGKNKKIYVIKYKAKKNYRRKQGHRQPYTRVRINEITL